MNEYEKQRLQAHVWGPNSTSAAACLGTLRLQGGNNSCSCLAAAAQVQKRKSACASCLFAAVRACMGQQPPPTALPASAYLSSVHLCCCAGLTLHLDNLRIHNRAALASGPEYTGNVLVAPSASVGSGCLIGEGAGRLQGAVLLGKSTAAQQQRSCLAAVLCDVEGMLAVNCMWVLSLH